MFSIRIRRILALRLVEARQIILKARKAIARNVVEEIWMYWTVLYAIKVLRFLALKTPQSN